jgi:hypothetical protein
VSAKPREHPASRLFVLVALVLMIGVIAGVGRLSPSVASAQGFGTVTVQKQLVLPNGQAVQAADLSGYVFTLRDAAGVTITMPATNQAGQSSIGVPPGNYFIAEQPDPSVISVSFTIGGQTVTGFQVAAGMTVQVTATNTVPGSGRITITKQIIDAAGNPIANADASGFTFAVAGPNNFSVTLTSPLNGVVTVSNLAPGNYTVTETPRQGFGFVAAAVDGVPVANGQGFPVANNQNRQLVFQNRAGAGSATVSIRKEIVDQSNNVVSGADRSGFQFTVTCGSFSGTATSDANGVATVSNVPAGSCQISEATRQGFTLVSIVPAGGSDIGNNGTFTTTAGQTFNITVRNRGMAASDMVSLPTGCSNQALTWPVGTALATVAAAVSPSGALLSIFRLDPVQQRFRGFSPTAPAFANDYTMVETPLEAVFFCMRSPGTLNRPVR